MKCPSCRFDNPETMKFCVECGTKLASRCGQCGAEMLPSYKFCGACGTPLGKSASGSTEAGAPAPAASPVPAPTAAPARPASPPSAPSPEGERKQVTVVFCALVTRVDGSPTDSLSPDVLHTLLSRFSTLAKEEVERYGGVIHRFLGQGFMALFGAPVAHEDHPRRALLAAVGLRDRLRAEADDLKARHGVAWDVRMGVDTGAVVVGGAGDMAVGEATRIAALLQEKAAEGEILTSAQTARLTRGQVALETREAVAGPDGASFEVWTATGSSALRAREAFLGDGLSPFVGRDQELAVLERLRDQAAEGRGQVVGLAGDAGAGKSRLLHEFYLRTFPGGGVSYLRGQCASFATGAPYRPLIDMIRKASNIAESDSSGVVRRKLRNSLQAVGSDPEATLPYLLRLLGVREGTESLDDLEPQAIQARTFAAMRRMLLDAGRRSLVVVEIEDLHWIDDTSAEFLDSLVEVMAAARMLVLLTYRSGFQPQWLEKSYATQIPMRRLSDDESRELVAALLRRADAPEDLSATILEKAEGNPLFLEELARTVAQSRAEGSDETSVPDTVQGILMARIDRLPEAHKALLRTASVLGREPTLEILRELWDRSEPMEPLLDDLQRWELLYKTPSEDRVVYFFKHALTQEVTYQSLLDGRRRELHARAARAFEERWADRLEDVYDRLIYHYPRAGDAEKTVHYLTRFAHDAAEAYAHAEAAKALRQALGHVEELEEDERDRRLVEVLLQLADSLLPLASFPETLELFQKYRERAEALGDPALAGPYHFWLAHTYTYMGFQDETREHAHRSIDEARAASDETTEGKARYVLGRDGFWSGRFGDGIENSLRAVVLLERAGEPWWQGQAYWVAGFNHFALGQFEEAIDSLERALALSEALDDYRLDTSWSLGYFYSSLGEATMGVERCVRGVEVSKDPLNSAVALGFLGYALLQRALEAENEGLDDAIEKLLRARGMMSEAGMRQIEGWFSVFLAEAHLANDDPERAREAAEAALAATEESKFLYGVGLAREMLGRAALSGKDLETARRDLETARERFESLEMPFGVARAELELADLAEAEEQTDAAKRHRAEARERFENLGLPRWVERA